MTILPTASPERNIVAVATTPVSTSAKAAKRAAQKKPAVPAVQADSGTDAIAFMRASDWIETPEAIAKPKAKRAEHHRRARLMAHDLDLNDLTSEELADAERYEAEAEDGRMLTRLFIEELAKMLDFSAQFEAEAREEAAEAPETKKLGRTSLQQIDISDIESATFDPPRFAVEAIVPAGYVTLFGGHGASGKSILAMAIAAHVAAGKPWHGLAVQRSPVLFVSLEDRRDLMKFRLKKIIAACGLDTEHVLENLRIYDGMDAGALMREGNGSWSSGLAELATLRELREVIADAALIVIDNASDAFDGNENNRQQVRTFVRTLGRLGRANDAAVLLLAHLDKAGARNGTLDNSYSGSTAWHNSVRSRIALVETDNDGVMLAHEKSNLGAKHAPMPLEWGDGVLLPRARDENNNAEGNCTAILAAMALVTQEGISIPIANKGVATTRGALESPPAELPAWLRGAAGRRAFDTAIATLHRTKQIRIDTYINDNRKTKKRYLVTASAPVAPVCASKVSQ